MRWKVISERSLHTDQWVDLRSADVELPDGRHLDHRLLRIRPSAGAAVVDGQRRVLLLWRHRFITDMWGWELPMGGIDEGETAEQTAAREVEEETGWRPAPLRHLISVNAAGGITDLRHHIYTADGAVQFGEPEDGFESRRVEWVALADLPELIAKEQIASSSTLVAMLLLAHMLT